jgi:hypothetical protein
MKISPTPYVALTTPNLAYYWWRYISNTKRTVRALLAPAASDDVSQIASIITRRGIVVTPGDQLLSESGRVALDEASEYVLNLSRRDEVQAHIASSRCNSPNGKDYLINLLPSSTDYDANSALLRLALDPNLLKAVSLYLGLWPRLHGIDAWLNFPLFGDPIHSQLWHRDPEDVKIVKAFIYLNDVDENCGPFCYIPGTHAFGERAAIVPKHKHPIRVLDDEMQLVIPPNHWLTCVGPARTVILADTVGYHRGGKPTRGNRVLITFTYTSGAPHKLPFLKYKFRVSGSPTWVKPGLQEYALRT